MNLKLVCLILVFMLLMPFVLAGCIDNPSFGFGKTDASDAQKDIENYGYEWESNEAYKLEFCDLGDNKCYVKILTNPIYDSEFTVTIPQTSPDGATVAEVGFDENDTEGFVEYSNLPQIMPKDMFEGILDKIANACGGETSLEYKRVRGYYILFDVDSVSESEKNAILKKYPFAEYSSFYIMDSSLSYTKKLQGAAILKTAGYTNEEYYADVLEYNRRNREEYNNQFPQIKYNCSEYISKVELPDSIEVIRKGAFRNCSALAEINIPEGVKYISEAAFQNCPALKHIVLPSTLEIIEREAFAQTGLKSVDFKGIPEFIEADIFADCQSLSLNEYENGLYIPRGDNPYAVLARMKSGATRMQVHKDTQIILPSIVEPDVLVTFENTKEWIVCSCADESTPNKVIDKEEMFLGSVGSQIYKSYKGRYWICASN